MTNVTTKNNDLNLDREAWLTEAAQLIQDEIIYPELPQDYEIPYPFRVSVGYPPRTRSDSKVIAVCIKAEASADQHNEIFVTPKLDDSIAILEALTHELVHQADNCQSGHLNFFARTARKIGLEGKLTQTYASTELKHKLQQYVTLLGDIPHAAINLDVAKKKQSTRMIKLYCPHCGWSFRTSQKNIDSIRYMDCLACGAEDVLKQD